MPGTARVRAARKRRASEGSPRVPAPRRPGVPERTWRRGGAEGFPSAGGGAQAALSPGGGCSAALTRAKAAKTGRRLPQRRRQKQRRLLRVVRPGPRARAPALALAVRVIHWLLRHGTASASANQRRAAAFGNFFPRVRARRGHAAAALRREGAGEAPADGRGPGPLWRVLAAPPTPRNGLRLVGQRTSRTCVSLPLTPIACSPNQRKDKVSDPLRLSDALRFPRSFMPQIKTST